MDKKTMPLTQLSHNKKARIVNLEGGYGFQRKLRVMGVREKQTVMIISRQPFRGPLTVTVGGCHLTLGRGMAQKIIVEEL